MLFGKAFREGTLVSEMKVAIRSDSGKELNRLVDDDYRLLARYRDEQGLSILHYAAHEGAEEIIGRLLESGYFQVDVRSDSGQTPLHIAASQGKSKVAQVLILNGADIDARDGTSPTKRSRTPIHLAISNNNIDVVKLLLEKGADIEQQCNLGNAFLTAMVGGDKYSIAQLLLSYGANPKSITWGGYSALHYDAEWGKDGGMLSDLIKLGIPVDLKKTDGETALFSTLQFDRIDNARILISMGANVNARDNNGNSILHKIAWDGDRHAKMAEFIIAHGAEVNARTPNGETPLHKAVFWGSPEIARILIKNGASINATMNDAFDRHHDRGLMESEWFEQYCKLNKLSPITNWCDGWTPLHIAAKSYNTDCLKALLLLGAEVNLQNQAGWTPLDVAYKKGNKTNIELLVASGALRGK